MARKVDFDPMTADETFNTVAEGMGFLSVDQVFDALKEALDKDDLVELWARLGPHIGEEG